MKIVIGGVIVIVLMFVGVVFIVGSPSDSLPVSPIQDDDNIPTYQERLNSMTLEDCENVSGSSPPEIRDRCMQIYRMATPAITANTQEKKDKVIQKLEKTYLFTDHDFNLLHFNITEDMLTPEGLEICVDLWEDMVQETLSIRTGDPKSIREAMEAQGNFKRSSCAGTQNEWRDL